VSFAVRVEAMNQELDTIAKLALDAGLKRGMNLIALNIYTAGMKALLKDVADLSVDGLRKNAQTMRTLALAAEHLANARSAADEAIDRASNAVATSGAPAGGVQ
jgi:hypothetical protein